MPRSIVGGKAFSLRRTPSGRGLGTVLVLLAGVCLATIFFISNLR